MSVRDIRVQKLFLVTLILKVGASFFGWLLRDPWILGFTVPLAFMSSYIVLGYFRRDNDVTDEKFADSCYYLGFIFTITSIIFSLFDLPNIGSSIQDIAVRFGAAMVSTVLGLVVRVYLVSFKKDVADAIDDAEDAALDATRKFTQQLTIVLERLRDFESQVDTAAKESVARVNLQVESLSKSHADNLTDFFSDLTSKNQEAFTSAFAEVKSSSERLAEAVDGYSLSMRANLTSIESKVGAFIDAISDRLKTTTFPDEYFAEHLKGPLSQLKESSTAVASGISASLQEVTKSTTILSTALKKLQGKAAAAEGSLETVLNLTRQQQAVLDSANGQLASFEQLSVTLSGLDDVLVRTLAGVTTSNNLTSELVARTAGIVSDGAETRRTLEVALTGVADVLKAQLQTANTVAATLGEGTAVTKAAAQNLSDRLDASTAAAESMAAAITAAAETSRSVAGRLDAAGAADLEAKQALSAVGQQAAAALRRVDEAAGHLQAVANQIGALGIAARAQAPESGDTAVDVESAAEVSVVPAGASEPAVDSRSQPPVSSNSNVPFLTSRSPASPGPAPRFVSSPGSGFAGEPGPAGASPLTGPGYSVTSRPTTGQSSQDAESGRAGTQTFPAGPLAT